jgi:hypothetical protein
MIAKFIFYNLENINYQFQKYIFLLSKYTKVWHYLKEYNLDNFYYI